MVRFDYSGAQPFFADCGPDFALADKALHTLNEGTGLGSDFIGWLTLPQKIKAGELPRILAAAEKIHDPSFGRIRHRVHGKIAASKIVFQTPREADGLGMTVVPVFAVTAEGRELHGMTVRDHGHGTVLYPGRS